MSKRSYLWRQAEVCLSRARVSGDPVLKELYEDLAAEFAHDALVSKTLTALKIWKLESRENPAHKQDLLGPTHRGLEAGKCRLEGKIKRTAAGQF
jgi:hypothetical protein